MGNHPFGGLFLRLCSSPSIMTVDMHGGIIRKTTYISLSLPGRKWRICTLILKIR